MNPQAAEFQPEMTLRYQVLDDKGEVLAEAGSTLSSQLLALLNQRGVRLISTAMLEVMKGPKAGLEIPVKFKPIKIGRDESCDIRPASSQVSKQHCVLRKQLLKLFVKDVGSTNGTWVNDVKIEQETELNSGDLIRVGNLELKVNLFLTVQGDERIGKAADGMVLAEREDKNAKPDAEAVTTPSFAKKDLAEFHRLLEQDKKKL